METLGSLRRTNYCGEVTLAMAGQEMTVCGSIARARDKGGIIFADLRDTTGILQLVFDEDTPKDVFAKAESLKSEYVVICRGKLRERAAKTDKIATGDVELYVSELRILSEAQTTPFELRDEINVNDDLRLRYRYLDLRRPSMHEPIVLRSKIMQIIRNYFCENHFTEIETPTLIKSTPEGARDYLVPSRVQPGHFYALPQSPQLYKQILMLSGFDRYFQLAHCYRDEDLRADRQPEFTQVDEEMSFVSEDDIMTLNEGLIKRLWKEMLNVDVETPFYRMPWDEAMGRFGSDKPDTRFGLEIQDVTEVFRGTEFKPFAAVLEAGGTIRAINAKGLADKLSRKNIDKLGEVAKTYGAKGLAYSRLTADGTSSSFEKFLTDAEKAALYAALNAETGDVLLLVSDTDWVKACTALGQVRLDIARKHGLIDPDKFNFLWVVDFPLFEYSEQEGRWMAMHHPFTLPKAEDLDKVESDPGACHAVAYDIVLNGVEMGGGSMRINDPALQDRMFHALGFTEEKARESFGFLMDAYKFGAPPHGGMAYGLDRMVMLMLKKDSIRDVIAFPKVQNAGEPMSGAPDVVDEQQLKVLERLRKDALDAGVQRFFRLVDGYKDTDFRHGVSLVVDAGQVNEAAHEVVRALRVPAGDTALGGEGHLAELDAAVIERVQVDAHGSVALAQRAGNVQHFFKVRRAGQIGVQFQRHIDVEGQLVPVGIQKEHPFLLVGIALLNMQNNFRLAVEAENFVIVEVAAVVFDELFSDDARLYVDVLHIQPAHQVAVVQLKPALDLPLGVRLIELGFILHGDVPARAVVDLQHELVRQLVEVDVVKAIPDAQQRDKVFLADFLLDPLAHGILVNEGIDILEPAVQLEPLGLLAEGLGVFEVERCVSVVCLLKPFFQRLGVVLFLQAGPVGVFLVGDLVIFRVGIQIFGADGRAVVGKVRQRLFRMAGQPGHGAANLVRRRAVDGLQLML